MVTLSVIVCNYNCRQYLSPLLRDLAQLDRNVIETIIVDDASTDGSYDVLVAEIPAGSRIVRNSQNRGLSASRNIGGQQARGEYVAFVDADDRIDPGTYNDVARALKAGDIDLVEIGFARFAHDDEINKLRSLGACRFAPLDGPTWLRENAVGLRRSMAPTKFVRRSIHLQCPFPEDMLYEDRATTFLFFLLAKRIYHSDCTGYFYRKRAKSITRTVEPKNIRDHFRSADCYAERLEALGEASVYQQHIASVRLINGFISPMKKYAVWRLKHRSRLPDIEARLALQPVEVRAIRDLGLPKKHVAQAIACILLRRLFVRAA